MQKIAIRLVHPSMGHDRKTAPAELRQNTELAFRSNYRLASNLVLKTSYRQVDLVLRPIVSYMFGNQQFHL
jgi:hypothetical protein